MRSIGDLYAFIYKGGWAMVPIIAFSVIALGMMIEKTWTFARVKGGNAVAERVLALPREGRRKERRTAARGRPPAGVVPCAPRRRAPRRGDRARALHAPDREPHRGRDDDRIPRHD